MNFYPCHILHDVLLNILDAPDWAAKQSLMSAMPRTLRYDDDDDDVDSNLILTHS